MPRRSRHRPDTIAGHGVDAERGYRNAGRSYRRDHICCVLYRTRRPYCRWSGYRGGCQPELLGHLQRGVRQLTQHHRRHRECRWKDRRRSPHCLRRTHGPSRNRQRPMRRMSSRSADRMDSSVVVLFRIVDDVVVISQATISFVAASTAMLRMSDVGGTLVTSVARSSVRPPRTKSPPCLSDIGLVRRGVDGDGLRIDAAEGNCGDPSPEPWCRRLAFASLIA